MLIITGTYPPERCGVGDYTQCILSTPTGSSFHLFYERNWQMSNLRQLCRQLKRTTDKVVNLQYPTMGYSTHLTPHLLALYAVLCLHRRLVLTIHEYSQLGWKGKLALTLLFLIASTVIFTTEFERDAARRRNPWLRRTAIIKINSNIPVVAELKPMSEREWDVCFFGFIRPNKGLEDFLSVATELREKRKGCRVYVMGQTQKETADYGAAMLNRLNEKGIEYIGDKTKEEVAAMLNHTKVAYLPYPDGLSERRGSFLAAAVNGCVVVSNKGPFTTSEQERLLPLADTDKAARTILSLLEDTHTLDKWQERSQEYVKNNVPTSWEQIAQQYQTINLSLQS